MSNPLSLRGFSGLLVLLLGPSLPAQDPVVKDPDESTNQAGVRQMDQPSAHQGEKATVIHLPMERLPAGTRLSRHSSDPSERPTNTAHSLGGASGERLVYSNTLGRVAVDFGANRLISDDVTITSTGRNFVEVTCRLTRMRFEVDGRVSEAPGQPSGPYTVTWALYNTCPYALTAGAPRLSRIVTNSAGSLQVNDDAPAWIEVAFPAETPVFAYTNMWFGATFSRGNAGLVSGTPAQVGHSADVIDFPGSACNANLGGFPTAPHGSFNLEIWGNTATCPEAYVAYKNIRESGAGINAGSTGPSVWLTDDITLQNACVALGFTVGVKGPGTYKFELRGNCGAPTTVGFTPGIIDGPSNQEPRVIEHLFPYPINISQSFSYAVNVNNLGAGAIVTGSQASIGQTLDFFERAPACEPEDLHVGLDALHFSLICRGPAPVGACCDMYLTTCDGGMLDGEPCDATAECQPTCSEGSCKINGMPLIDDDEPVVCTDNSQCQGGTCTSTCKEVPQTNCPFPPRFTGLIPAWEEGKTCASDPSEDGAFPGLICGEAACCTPDNTCMNLTRTECSAIPSEGPFPWWQLGRLCDVDGQVCPIVDCVLSTEPCEIAHASPGCSNNDCCVEVCLADPFCCTTEWDRPCVDLADVLCTDPPTNDLCYSPFGGATPMGSNDTRAFSNRYATTNQAEAGLCSLPEEHRCVRNGLIQEPCPSSGDCVDGGVCSPVELFGLKTVWFQFVASHSSARIGTCNSSSGADSVLQVYEAQDAGSGQTACASLVPISCTLADGCGQTSQSCLCVKGLSPGKTYYIMVGSTSEASAGIYQLDIASPCTGTVCCPRQDCNENCLYDGLEIALGDEADCDANTVPDSCELLDPANDCNKNGLLDACEAMDVQVDCDRNGFPDECDLEKGRGSDCDNSTVLDSCELDAGSLTDCDENGIIDACELENADCDGDSMLDECQLTSHTDCDRNQVLDTCDLQQGALDCNNNSLIDRCDWFIPYDSDSDYDVDMLDFAFFENCFEPVGWPHQCCRLMDRSPPYESVNSFDYAEFNFSLSGPL